MEDVRWSNDNNISFEKLKRRIPKKYIPHDGWFFVIYF
jgi:hypothetical protein